MKIAFAIPSANPQQCGATFARWKAMDYLTAVIANGPAYKAPITNCDFRIDVKDYPGWGTGCNIIGQAAIKKFDCTYVVHGGDDHWPDPNKTAHDIANEIHEHFNGSTLSVTQPIGDAWPCAGVVESICGSPIVGRDFEMRWNEGHGPFALGYAHTYVDQELHDTAKLHGLLWQRKDLSHYHAHFARPSPYIPPPIYMASAYGASWSDRARYLDRKRLGFPNHLPIEWSGQ